MSAGEVGEMGADRDRDVDGRVVVEGGKKTSPFVKSFKGVDTSHHSCCVFDLCTVAVEQRRPVHVRNRVERCRSQERTRGGGGDVFPVGFCFALSDHPLGCLCFLLSPTPNTKK